MRASKSDPVCYTSQKKCECERKKQAKKDTKRREEPAMRGYRSARDGTEILRTPERIQAGTGTRGYTQKQHGSPAG